MGRTSNRLKLATKLKQKSIEAFMLCLEIYNKPTINYRIEASSYLICNAWELMLKSHYVLKNGEKSIYRKGDEKTYSLETMLNKYYEVNSAIRKNLMYIIENVRNKSTHLIVREHDLLYTPLLQRAVLNYVEEIKVKLNVNMQDLMSQESLALIVKSNDKKFEISKLYGKTLARMYQSDEKNLTDFIQTNTSQEGNSNVVAVVESTLAFIKDPQKADITAYYSSGGTALQKIIVPKEVNVSHPYTLKIVIKKIKDHFKDSIELNKLNQHTISEYNKKNKIEQKPEFFARLEYSSSVYKKFSQAYVDKLIKDIESSDTLFRA